MHTEEARDRDGAGQSEAEIENDMQRVRKRVGGIVRG